MNIKFIRKTTFTLLLLSTQIKPENSTYINSIEKYQRIKKDIGEVNEEILESFILNVLKDTSSRNLPILLKHCKEKPQFLDQLIITMKNDLKSRIWLKNNPQATKELIEKNSTKILEELNNEKIEKLFQQTIKTNPTIHQHEKYNQTITFILLQRIADYVAKNDKTFNPNILTKLLENQFNKSKQKKDTNSSLKNNLLYLKNTSIYYQICEIAKNLYKIRQKKLKKKLILKKRIQKLFPISENLICNKTQKQKLLEEKNKIEKNFNEIKSQKLKKVDSYINILEELHYAKTLKNSHIELLESETQWFYIDFFNPKIYLIEKNIEQLEKDLDRFENLIKNIQKINAKKREEEKEEKKQAFYKKIRKNFLNDFIQKHKNKPSQKTMQII